MKKLTKVMAIIVTILVWLPVTAPVMFCLLRLIIEGRFNFDFLMPAELFLVEITGGLGLIFISKKTKIKVELISKSFVTAIISLISGQFVAVVSGLASGKIEPKGWIFLIVLLLLWVYNAAVVGMGLGGIKLIKKL